MRQFRSCVPSIVAALCAVAIGAGPMAAQNGNAPDPTVDSAATRALRNMGEYLRTVSTFQVRAEVATEEVLEDGQKIQFASHVDMVADRPNRFRIDLTSDRKQRIFLYDGVQFTIFAPRQKFYATVSAPKTIVELTDELEAKYAIDLPFVDLFRWGTPEADTVRFRSAKVIGPSVINDITTTHYAFRQDGMDWQLWIQEGSFPLPLKLVITTLTDDARPQHSAVYTWNLAPSYNAETFRFTAPDDAKRITIAQAHAMRTASGRRAGGSNR
jgi:hypothetical protein